MSTQMIARSATKVGIWQQAQNARIDKMEAKAVRKARKQGAPRAVLHTSDRKDRLALEARGWSFDAASSVGIASPTRFWMSKALPES